jgi:hypothetical protein
MNTSFGSRPALVARHDTPDLKKLLFALPHELPGSSALGKPPEQHSDAPRAVFLRVIRTSV